MKRVLSDIKVLSDGELQEIHGATLDILSTVGMKFPNQEVLEILQKNGAAVDFQSQVAKFPPAMVEKHLQAARKNSSYKVRLEDGMHVNAGDFRFNLCGQVTIFDWEKQQRRYCVYDDVVRFILLGNQLKNVGVNGAVTPSDVPSNLADIYMAKALYTYSTKPVRPWVLTPQSAEIILEIARIAHGPEDFKKKKPVFYTVESISPLRFGDNSLEIGLIMVRNGMNIGLGPIPMSGATGPITLAGNLTLANAEALGGIVLVQCLNPGQPMYYHGGSHSIDLKTTICAFGSPNQTLSGLAHLQLAKHYGLPCIANVGGHNSLGRDTQAGVEAGAGLALALAGGIGHSVDMGLTGSDQTMSFEQVVVDNEWVDFLNHIFSGFEVSRETIAADVIKSVGIGGNFLMEDHTVKHMREFYWESSLFSCDTWDGWEARGRDSIFDRAHKKVMDIFRQHYPPKPVVSAEKVNKIEALVEEATRKAKA